MAESWKQRLPNLSHAHAAVFIILNASQHVTRSSLSLRFSLSLVRTVRVFGPHCVSLWELSLIREFELNPNDVDPFPLLDCDNLYSMWGAVHNYWIWSGSARYSFPLWGYNYLRLTTVFKYMSTKWTLSKEQHKAWLGVSDKKESCDFYRSSLRMVHFIIKLMESSR